MAVGSRAFVPEIESLRGWAITLVFVFHLNAWVMWGHPLPPDLSPLSAFVFSGHTGVSLFFVISGFLLSRPFLVEAVGGRRVDRVVYFKRRALRILPLYFTAVIVGTVLSAHQPHDLLQGVPYLLFLQSISGMTTIMRPYSAQWWSLATEVQFYIVLPLLPLCLRSRRARWVGAVVFGIYAAAYGLLSARIISLPTLGAQLALWTSVFGRGPLFAMGIGAAWVWMQHGERLRAWGARSLWLRNGGADLALVALLWVLGILLRAVAPLTLVGADIRWPAWHLLEGALWTVVVLLLLAAPLRSKRLLANRYISTIGLVSYSIYFVHNPFIVWFLYWLNRLWPGVFLGWSRRTLAVLPVLVALCLALSACCYWGIERPFLRRKERVV